MATVYKITKTMTGESIAGDLSIENKLFKHGIIDEEVEGQQMMRTIGVHGGADANVYLFVSDKNDNATKAKFNGTGYDVFEKITSSLPPNFLDLYYNGTWTDIT